MSYRLDRFNGTFLVNVEDGSVDTTTDLRFLGKNYAGYGEVQNENFLHLLENFANTSPPPKAITGQIWFDSNPNSRKLKFWDGNQWKTASGAAAASSAPAGLSTGDFWFDTTTDQLYAWNGNSYILVGPENTLDLTATSVFGVIVKDNLNANHTILKVNINDQTQAVISSTEFILNSAVNPIPGFTLIKKGFNLLNTDPSTGITNTDHYFWGNTSNSLKFDGRPVSDFVLQEQFGRFLDNGFTVGDQEDLRIWIENGDIPVIENRLGAENPNASIIFRIKTSPTDDGNKDVAIVTSQALIPGIDNSFQLGTETARWSQIHGLLFFGNLNGNVSGNLTGNHKGDLLDIDNFVRFDHVAKKFIGDFEGNLVGNVTGNLSGNASTASALLNFTTEVSAIPNSIPIRGSDGSLTASIFKGISERADLLKTGLNYRSASVQADPNTVAVRDGSGNLTAILFQGTATSAQYADLAEKYLTDKQYEVGTVISVGGSSEVRESYLGDRAIGVISENPAFRMNSLLENGQYIALKGRVPVKVIGKVKKGDRLKADNQGLASVAEFHEFHNVFSISLEDSDLEDVKLIESIIL